MTSKGPGHFLPVLLVLRTICLGLGLSLQHSILLGLNRTGRWGEGFYGAQVVKAKIFELSKHLI